MSFFDAFEDIFPLLAGGGLLALTGGLGTPAALGATGGEAAMGAGLGVAGDALAAQGAAGLLGSAGAAAAGYGAPASIGLGAAGGTGAVGGTASFGPNNEFVGNTIASELSPNAYTGGFDNLNPFERIGQRVSGFLDEGGMDTLGKFKGAFNSPQQQPQEPQNREISGQPVQAQPEQQGQMPYVYGQPQVEFTDEQKRRLMEMQNRGLL